MEMITGSDPILRPIAASSTTDRHDTLTTTETRHNRTAGAHWKFMLGLSSFALFSLSSLASGFAASASSSAIAPPNPSQHRFQPASENRTRVERSTNQRVMQLAQGDVWTRQVLNQLEKAARAAINNGARQTHEPFVGDLGRGADDTTTVTLRKGMSYTILGVCDEHCSDIDLELYDDNGKLVASDTGRNDIPMVGVTPRWNARFTVRVMMPRCTKAPCRYGIGVFGK